MSRSRPASCRCPPLALFAQVGVTFTYQYSGAAGTSPLAAGGTLAYPVVAAGSASLATIYCSNQSSSSYAMSAAGQPGSFSGTLVYSVAGVSHRILLSGVAVTAAASLAFELAAAGAQAIQPGDTIVFPSVAVGTPAALSLRVRNTGTAAALISTLTASPSSFQLQNAPALPLSIAAGGSATVSLNFVPPNAGNNSGTLRIGESSLVLSGVGTGSRFSCTVTARGQMPSSCDGSSITLPSTQLGDQLPFTVQISNAGNQPGALQNFDIGGTGFAVAATPSLPVTLAPGDSIQIHASFTPTVLGITGGFLQINGQTSNIVVAGAAPPSLPAISFTNANAQMLPLAQPLIGIHLASAYPYDLSGRLSLSFTSESLVDDPAIQFLNGQRYVDFKIPGGATDAVFGTTAKGIVMQTGSSAGAIALSASFSLGTYTLTAAPVTQNISIPAAAPQIRAFQIGAMDNTGFDLLLTGVSTTRSLTQLAFTLTPADNSALATTTLTADVSTAFNDWYNGGLSRSFGGQFTVSVRFNVVGDVAAIKGIAATATNGLGTSESKFLTLQSSAGQ